MAKMQIVGNSFADLAEALDKMTGNIQPAVDEALRETQIYITEQLETAMIPHNNTFKVVGSLVKNQPIDWHGSIAYVNVGFDLKNGGMPSIYLMYGTPKMKKDTKLYNAIKGTKTKKAITEIQTEVLNKHINFSKK